LEIWQVNWALASLILRQCRKGRAGRGGGDTSGGEPVRAHVGVVVFFFCCLGLTPVAGALALTAYVFVSTACTVAAETQSVAGTDRIVGPESRRPWVDAHRENLLFWMTRRRSCLQSRLSFRCPVFGQWWRQGQVEERQGVKYREVESTDILGGRDWRWLHLLSLSRTLAP
jgi:hypothetical protein